MALKIENTNIWFTADHHFWHRNILKFQEDKRIMDSGREFYDIFHMNQYLKDSWNNVVLPEDVIFYLGDLSWGSKEATKTLIHELNGNIYFIKGNHDKSAEQCKNLFKGFYDYLEIDIKDEDGFGGWQRIILCHYAFLIWNKKHFGSWNLHGHSHGSLKKIEGNKRLDVGVDCWKFTPVNYNIIKEEFKKDFYKFKPLDHHVNKLE